MTGYKVVSVGHDGVLSSATVCGLNTIYSTQEYTERTEADELLNGPLAVFNTYENAVNFIRRNTSCLYNPAIYSCEYEESTDKELFFFTYGGYMQRCNYQLPSGTVFADRVKLMERIDGNDRI